VIAEAFRRGMMVEEIAPLCHFDRWFLVKIRNLVEMESTLSECGAGIVTDAGKDVLEAAKRMGYPDRTIADLTGKTEHEIRTYRKGIGLIPVYKIVDTCAAEFEAQTPYFYSCYDSESER